MKCVAEVAFATRSPNGTSSSNARCERENVVAATAQPHRMRDANARMVAAHPTEHETCTTIVVLPGTAQPHQMRTRGKGGRKPIKRETRMTGGGSAWHSTTPRRTRDAKDGEQEEDVASTPSANATCKREEDVAGTPSSNATYEWW